MEKNHCSIRLGTKIALYIFAFGVLFGLALTLIFYQYTQESVLAQAEITLTDQAHQAAHFVDALLSSRIDVAKSIAANQALSDACAASNAQFAILPDETRAAAIQELDARWQGTDSIEDPFVAQYLDNDAAHNLSRQMEAHPGEFGEIFLTNRFGALVATTGKLTTLAHGHKPWWLGAYSDGHGADYLDDRGYDLSVGDYVLGVVVPIRSDGDVIGILKCNFSILVGLGKVIRMADHAIDANISLARSNGLIVYGEGKQPLQSTVPDELAALLPENESGWTRITEEGRDQLIAFREVSSTAISISDHFGGTAETIDHRFGNEGESWVVIVSQDYDQVMAPARVAAMRVAMIVAGFILAMALTALILGWRIAKPTRSLAKQAQALGSGQMDARVAVSSHDEIGNLAQSFNTMAAYLESTMVSRDELSEEVARRKLVEGVLKTSEARYRQLATHSPDVIWTADLHGKFTYVSPSVEQLRGYTPEEVMEQPMADAFTPASMEQAVTALQELGALVALKESFALEKQLRFEQPCKDGSTVWTEASMTTMHNDAGTFIGILGISRDISQRKKAEDALQESEERYRTLFENMINGFALHKIVLDEAGAPSDYIFLEANASFEKLTGLNRHQIVGKKATDVIPGIEQDPVNWIGKYGNTALTGEEVRFEQYSEGLDKWFSVLAFRPQEGQFATIFEDITPRKRAEEEKLAMESNLRQRQKLQSLGTMARGVAHEINNPLMGMINYADLIKERTDAEQLSEFAGVIMSEGQRIAKIVSGLLSFSRQETGAPNLVPMKDIINNSLTLVGSLLRADQIAVELDIPEELSFVKCRRQQIQQVLINLLINAQYYLNERYPAYDEDKILRIVVRPFEENGAAWIRTTVEDHGGGIPDDVLARIFDPFFSTKPRHEGPGLGLSVSFGIIEEHEGRLTAESVVGETTRIHMDLLASVKEE